VRTVFVENPPPVPEPADDEALWMDPVYRLALAQRELENHLVGRRGDPVVFAAGRMGRLPGRHATLRA